MNLDLSMLPSEALSRKRERWRACDGDPIAALLRLQLVHGLLRATHANRSLSLASGDPLKAANLQAWEERLELFRNASPVQKSMDEFLLQAEDFSETPAERKPPEALRSALGREKLDRYDRKWESALAAEGFRLGCEFWCLHAWVQISAAERWNTLFSEALWPNGLVLFVEAGASPAVPGDSIPLWSGKWTVLLRPGFSGRRSLVESSQNWPGTPPTPPEPPTWNLLFAALGR